MNKLNKKIKKANSYEEWKDLALKHDKATGMEQWKYLSHSKLYDNEEISLRLQILREFRAKNDDLGLLFTLNEGIHGNMGGMGNSRLYNKALSGTKQLVVDYVDEIADALLHLADMDNHSVSFEEKVDFFRRASLCFGRSALMLSGGAQLGNFHIGVLKTLVEHDLLPDVISGSSAGAIFAALTGTYTDEELVDYMKDENLELEIKQESQLLESFFQKRNALNIQELEKTVNRLIPNLTFQEAYERTGRKINISVAPHKAHQKSRLLNAIASPNVLIRSAVMASCAIPGKFSPVTLLAKNKDGETQPYLSSRRWVDGSMSNDLPSKRLTRLYRVNHFIVSLANPLVLPFVGDPSNQNEYFAPFRKFGGTIIKEMTQFNYSIAKQFFKYAPNLALVAHSINSVVQQEYTGNINIMADFSGINPTKLMSSLTYEELAGLIKKGEQATWPKLEAIRVTTKIGRILDDIRVRYEAAELEFAKRSMPN